MAVPEVLDILKEMEELHLKKSADYGSDQDPLHNFNAVAKGAGIKNYYYPILRCMEKLTRAANLLDAGRDDELEEEFKDVALLMVLAEAMRRQAIPDPSIFKPSLKLYVGRATPESIDRAVAAIQNSYKKSTNNAIKSVQAWPYTGLDDEPHVMVDAFRKNVIVDDLPEDDDETDLPTRHRVEKEQVVGITSTDIGGELVSENLVKYGLAASRGEAHDLINAGSIYIDDKLVTKDRRVKSDELTLRKGKRQTVNKVSYPLGKESE